MAIEEKEDEMWTCCYKMDVDGWELLWVFRALDSAIWDELWASNEQVSSVSETVIGSGVQMVVMEDYAHCRVMKFLMYDEDVGDWRLSLDLVCDKIIIDGDDGSSDGSNTTHTHEGSSSEDGSISGSMSLVSLESESASSSSGETDQSTVD